MQAKGGGLIPPSLGEIVAFLQPPLDHPLL